MHCSSPSVRPLNQLGLMMTWGEGKGRKNPREANVILWPYAKMWTCAQTRVEDDPWEVGNEGILKKLLENATI